MPGKGDDMGQAGPGIRPPPVAPVAAATPGVAT